MTANGHTARSDVVKLNSDAANTALELTADPRFGLSRSVGFATCQFGGGPAFGRLE
jgi:hypothetical protein